jgi:adenosylhomocysteine nucleosidase
MFMASSLVHEGSRELNVDFKISPEVLASTPGLRVGRLLTVDALVGQAEDKRRLGEEHQAQAVDMESWNVGEVCRQAKTRFLSVRIISDAVDDVLPPEVETLARQTTTAARLGAAAGAIFRRPSSLKDMLKLKEEALLASDRLAKFLAGVIPQLAPLPAAEAPQPS